ncbi:MAG: protease complex subunit PrcB family protein [Phycisphaeraceae bacterium]|nr:protease complex subunit PrcB family protein [Phycisphaeraceae bacterium]
MRTVVFTVILGSLLSLPLMGCAGSSGDDLGGGSVPTATGDMKLLPILAQRSGEDPGLRLPLVRLINTEAELAALGAKDVGQIQLDLKKQSLIVLALGEQPTAGYWTRILSIQRSGDKIYVQGIANKPVADSAAAKVVSYPYCAVVVAKVTGLIVPEIDQLKGQTPPDAAKP